MNKMLSRRDVQRVLGFAEYWKRTVGLCVSALCVLLASYDAAAAEKMTFETRRSLKGWKTRGDVSIDREEKRSGRASLKVAPGAVAVRKLRDENGAAKVEMWIYESQLVPEDPEARQSGPLWGLIQEDSPIWAVGPVYAPYLSGKDSYAAAHWDPAEDGKPWWKVQYIGRNRKKGWHKWTFEMDAEEGLKIYHNGKNINAEKKRFDWQKSNLKGVTGVVFFGGRTDAKQALWVDDLTVELGGKMKAQLKSAEE